MAEISKDILLHAVGLPWQEVDLRFHDGSRTLFLVRVCSREESEVCSGLQEVIQEEANQGWKTACHKLFMI